MSFQACSRYFILLLIPLSPRIDLFTYFLIANIAPSSFSKCCFSYIRECFKEVKGQIIGINCLCLFICRGFGCGRWIRSHWKDFICYLWKRQVRRVSRQRNIHAVHISLLNMERTADFLYSTSPGDKIVNDVFRSAVIGFPNLEQLVIIRLQIVVSSALR